MTDWDSIILVLLGPLCKSHDDLWQITIGQAYDLTEAHRYAEYLQSRKDARAAIWGMIPHCKKLPTIEDLVGIWLDGEVVTQEENNRRLRARLRKKKDGEVSGGAV